MLSERALRDYAYRVLDGVYGERIEHGIIIPATKSKAEIAEFVKRMPRWQLDEMYKMIYGSEMVE